MKHKIKYFTSIAAITFIILTGTSAFAGGDILITVDELSSMIGKPGVVIVDAREEKSYNRKHLPGAVNLSYVLIVKMRNEIAIKKFSAPLHPDKAEKLFSDLGISNDSTIVVYDSPPSVGAAYVRFTLKMYGAENVRILKGGTKAWRKAKKPFSRSAVTVEPAVFKADLNSEVLKNADWIVKNKSDIQLLDTRSLEEYVGARSIGHIPGAVLMEWKELASAKASFKTLEEMIKEASKVGISKDKELLIYCEIGPKATFSFAAFEMLGYKPKFYWGSIVDWQDDPNRPIAKK